MKPFNQGKTSMIDRRRFGMQLLASCGAGVIAVATVGCSSTPKSSGWRDWLPGKKEPKPELPSRMAVMWTPDILSGAGHTTTRGFGGRIFFFNERGKPAMVAGDLTIHGFDENDPAGASNARRYRFTAEQLPSHFSENDLGCSYSFWLPWDAMGEPQRRITLVTTFQPVNGARPVQSEAATVLLPGPHPAPPPVLTPPTTMPDASITSPAYSGPTNAGRTAMDGLQTTTIRR